MRTSSLLVSTPAKHLSEVFRASSDAYVLPSADPVRDGVLSANLGRRRGWCPRVSCAFQSPRHGPCSVDRNRTVVKVEAPARSARAYASPGHLAFSYRPVTRTPLQTGVGMRSGRRERHCTLGQSLVQTQIFLANTMDAEGRCRWVHEGEQ
ncbi:hypothetical protein BV25DRAFT_1030180 [Artomyces pyxidatus]|uniref:Uncharacterized protein n=1 Tax=Artomyces pyxidatus TaxID=48021 RepID=A0ACB8STW1_9AGAM|nr:hypothetical protein BV25DRAFT_1030180 [Artomyces pyxidatus]